MEQSAQALRRVSREGGVGGVGPRGAARQSRQSVLVEGMERIEHGLVVAAQMVGDLGRPLAPCAGEQHLAAPQHKRLGGTQTCCQGMLLGVRQGAHKNRFSHASQDTTFSFTYIDYALAWLSASILLGALLVGCGDATQSTYPTHPLVFPAFTPMARSGLTLGTVLVTYRSPGRGQLIDTLAWSPDGKRIVYGNRDGTVQIWEASSGRKLLDYTSPTAREGVGALAWSPDGKRIALGTGAYGSAGVAQVWDATTGKTLLTYRGQRSQVTAVAWSPDGKRIASGSYDKTVQVWDATTGKTLLTYRGHTDRVQALAWSSDGKRIASAGTDATVQVWNATTGKTLLIYRGHRGEVDALAWSLDGARIASGSQISGGISDDISLQIWDAATGTSVFTNPTALPPLAWSPDGKRIVSLSANGSLIVWVAPEREKGRDA